MKKGIALYEILLAFVIFGMIASVVFMAVVAEKGEVIKEAKMDKHQKQAVMDVVDNEGFDYAFMHYSDFEDVEDEEFHTARKEYLKAREKLAKLIGYEE